MAADPLDIIARICHEQPHDALTQIAEALGYAEGVPMHRNHLPDLRYVLLTLERVTPAVKKDADLRGQVVAAINGMRYIIERTEQAQRTAGVAPVEDAEAAVAALENARVLLESGTPDDVRQHITHAIGLLRPSGVGTSGVTPTFNDQQEQPK
jgi:hypothetical protein